MMAIDRFDKVYDSLSAESSRSGFTLAVGLGEGKGDSLIVLQESEDMMILDSVRQTRTIGVRLVAVSESAVRAREIMNLAVQALASDPRIRIFDRTGMSMEVDDSGPAPEGVVVYTQRIDLR